MHKYAQLSIHFRNLYGVRQWPVQPSPSFRENLLHLMLVDSYSYLLILGNLLRLLLLVHLLVNLPHFHNVPIQLNCDKNWMSKEKTGLICRISVHLLVLSGRHYHDKYACFAHVIHILMWICVLTIGRTTTTMNVSSPKSRCFIHKEQK